MALEALCCSSVSAVENKVFLERRSFQKGPSSRGSSQLRDFRDSKKCGETRRI